MANRQKEELEYGKGRQNNDIVMSKAAVEKAVGQFGPI